MSTLATVEQVLRDTKSPMSVRDIVDMAGDSLPSRSRTPDTVVARDLSVNIKRLGEKSRFVRTAPGRYTMREYVESGLVKMGDCGLRALSLRHQPDSETTSDSARDSSVSSFNTESIASSGTRDERGILQCALREGRQGMLGALKSHDASSVCTATATPTSED